MNNHLTNRLLRALKSLKWLSGVFTQQVSSETEAFGRKIADLARKEEEIVNRPTFGSILQDVLRNHAKLMREEQKPTLAILIENVERLASDETLSLMRRDENMQRYLSEIAAQIAPTNKANNDLMDVVYNCCSLAALKAGAPMHERLEQLYRRL
ncbi:MAG: hypothetical protein AB8B83_04595 [Bdellovibrionales bacterium]